MELLWFEVLGFASGTLGCLLAVPQLWRIIKAKSADGVSILSWMLFLLSGVGWIIYAVKVNSISQIVMNIISCALMVVLVFCIARFKYSKWVISTFLISLILVWSVILWVVPFWVIATLLLGLTIVFRVPQIYRSFQSFQYGLRTVVSKMSHIMAVASASGWLIYGLLTDLWLNVVSSAIIIVSASVVVGLEIFADRRRKKTTLLHER